MLKHQLEQIQEENQMMGTILKIAKIVAFPILVGIWLTGWTMYSKHPNGQVSDEKWKMIIIPRED